MPVGDAELIGRKAGRARMPKNWADVRPISYTTREPPTTRVPVQMHVLPCTGTNSFRASEPFGARLEPNTSGHPSVGGFMYGFHRPAGLW